LASAKSPEQEVRAALDAMYMAQSLYRAEHGRYCLTPTECGFKVPFASRYRYLMGHFVLGSEFSEDRSVLDSLAERNIKPVLSEKTFTIVAVANLDDDPDYDVWLISHAGDIVHKLKDLP
jgi:hypothetical protein